MNINEALRILKIVNNPVYILDEIGIKIKGVEGNHKTLKAIQCLYEYVYEDINQQWDIDEDDGEFWNPRKNENALWLEEEDDEIKALFVDRRFKYGYLIGLGNKLDRSPKSIADRFAYFCKHFGLDDY